MNRSISEFRSKNLASSFRLIKGFCFLSIIIVPSLPNSIPENARIALRFLRCSSNSEFHTGFYSEMAPLYCFWNPYLMCGYGWRYRERSPLYSLLTVLYHQKPSKSINKKKAPIGMSYKTIATKVFISLGNSKF